MENGLAGFGHRTEQEDVGQMDIALRQVVKVFAIGRADLEVRERRFQSTPLWRAEHRPHVVGGRGWKWTQP